MKRNKMSHLPHHAHRHRPGALYWETWCGKRVLMTALYTGYTGTAWKEPPLCPSCAASQLLHETLTTTKEEN